MVPYFPNSVKTSRQQLFCGEDNKCTRLKCYFYPLLKSLGWPWKLNASQKCRNTKTQLVYFVCVIEDFLSRGARMNFNEILISGASDYSRGHLPAIQNHDSFSSPTFFPFLPPYFVFLPPFLYYSYLMAMVTIICDPVGKTSATY
jgi:hypothetical protein